MYFILPAFLTVLSFAGGAKAYDYEADGLTTARLVVTCIYAVIYLGLVGLCVPALAIARGHRVPYVPLLIAVGLTLLAVLAQIARDFLIADGDPSFDIPGDAFIATGAISTLFYYWSVTLVFLAFAHLIKVRADNVLRSSGLQRAGLSPVWSIAYFVVFVILFVFATTTSGLYISVLRAIYGNELLTIREISDRIDTYNNLLYTFNALWYASTFLLGALAFFAFKMVKRAGVNDTVLKTLLFVAFPIHVLHILEELAFLIVFSPSGLKVSRSNLETIEAASLVEVILYLGLHAGTIAVLIFLGMRRSNWMLGGDTATSQLGQYAGYPAYQTQGNYPVQGAYPAQTSYMTQVAYPAQTQYVDDSRTHLRFQQ